MSHSMLGAMKPVRNGGICAAIIVLMATFSSSTRAKDAYPFATDENVYSWAFATPAVNAIANFARAKTPNLVYTEVVNENPPPLPARTPSRPLCTSVQIVEKGVGDACLPVYAVYDRPSCRNDDDCAVLRFDPSVLKDEGLRTAIVQGLASPCQHVMNPYTLNGQGPINRIIRHVQIKGAPFNAEETWTILGCPGAGRPQLQAKDIAVDAAAGEIKFRFRCSSLDCQLTRFVSPPREQALGQPGPGVLTQTMCVLFGATPAGRCQEFPFTTDDVPYSLAFGAAVIGAITEAVSGKTYYEALGYDLTRKPRKQAILPICTAKQIVDIEQVGDYCSPSRAGHDLPQCHNNEGCGALRMDPSALADQRLRAAIESAIADPCRYVIDPEYFGDDTQSKNRIAKNSRPKGVAYSARENWTILGCNSPYRKRLYGIILSYDSQSGLVTFKFR